MDFDIYQFNVHSVKKATLCFVRSEIIINFAGSNEANSGSLYRSVNSWNCPPSRTKHYLPHQTGQLYRWG